MITYEHLGPKDDPAPAPKFDGGLPQQFDPLQLVDFEDLKRLKICNNRTSLHRLQRDCGFPRPLKTKASTQARAVWRRRDVQAWLEQHLIAAE
jgi:hypothetical protein